MTHRAGNTSYIYDQYGRLITMTNPFNEATQYLYDSIGRLHRKTLQPGMFEEYSYDGLDRLSQMKVVSPQGVVTRLESYAYNSASEVLSHTVDGVTTSYSYDASSQLTAESRPGYNVGYTFDGNGNRLTKTVNGVTENYTYDNGDKLLGAGLKTYQYDAAGRTTRIGNQVLTYDDEDRLVSYGGRTNVYNGFDTRVSSAVGGTNYSYHRDGSGVTAPMLSNSIQTFTPGISTRYGSTTSYQHGGLKDVSAISNSSGALTGSRVYDAYGATISTTGSWAAPFGYGGKYGYQEDGNGLQLLGHRYYDPSTGRFLTRDPIKDGRNWYVYCENNPLGSTDPDGLEKQDQGPGGFVLDRPKPGTQPKPETPNPAKSDVPHTKTQPAPAGAVGAGARAVLGRIFFGVFLLLAPTNNVEEFDNCDMPCNGSPCSVHKKSHPGRGMGGKKAVTPKAGKGGNDKGRGDDPAWNMSLTELNAAIEVARKAGDTVLMRKLQAIKKQRFRGRRDGS